MNDFKTILIKLKEIIKQQHRNNKKVSNKEVAQLLNIKATTLAGMKYKDKPPYQAILTYCHNNRLDVRKILYDEFQPIIDYPKQSTSEDGKVRVKYFRTLVSYEKWLANL